MSYSIITRLHLLASALLLTALVYVGITGWGYVVEGARRRSLTRLFGTYVPPELVAQMARDPQRYGMQAENRELTVMFCDMRNFTRVSEALPPEELRALVNRFFSAMTQEIRAHRGTLDKYIGDAIMAFWNAPLDDKEHQLNACNAALDMLELLSVHQGLSRNDAYSLMSVAADFGVTQVVDGTKGIHVRIDRGLFPARGYTKDPVRN